MVLQDNQLMMDLLRTITTCFRKFMNRPSQQHRTRTQNPTPSGRKEGRRSARSLRTERLSNSVCVCSHLASLKPETFQDEDMRMTPNAPESIRCSLSSCCCAGFKPGKVQLRSCDRCGHGWVEHALKKFQVHPPSGSGPVEVALPGLVFDLSSLVLFGAQAIPVQLKILLDRLFSILTPEQVGQILNSLGWSLGDYVRGYMLHHPSGKVLDRWYMATPEEVLLVLKQFLRFGETRPIVELMMLQYLDGENLLPYQESEAPVENVHSDILTNKDTSVLKRSSLSDERLVDGTYTSDCYENVQERQSLLTSFHLPQSAIYCSTKDSVPPRKLQNIQQKFAGNKLVQKHNRERYRCVEDDDLVQKRLERGRKGRVSCGVCGKSFYDKGTLKIHYNAVHLKIKHRCTVVGCTMVFSSLRSRNRHSANPNPRLHTGGSREAQPCRNTACGRETQIYEVKQEQTLVHATNMKNGVNSHEDSCHNMHHESASLAPLVLRAPSSGSFPSSWSGLLTSQLCSQSNHSLPKKKPRKSSMPVKIEIETVQSRRHKDES
ncbi:hypothetical protein CRENBAI_019424 [Crenichthys baileyi]|uniref:C2H2-type domain-containing protein n=1 Tax=Crenichthys baileyi TaxID=28760 RepID=A0AAV9SAU4_9TELE